MKWIITFLIILITIHADSTDDLDNKYTNIRTKFKVDYEAKCRKLDLAYIKQLEKLQIETTKKGDLDGALKIKAKIAEIKKQLKANTFTVVPKNDINNVDEIAIVSLAGNWQQCHKAKTVLKLNADKSAIYNKRNKGTWKAANGILTVTWSHGPVEVYKFTNLNLIALKTTAIGKLYGYTKLN